MIHWMCQCTDRIFQSFVLFCTLPQNWDCKLYLHHLIFKKEFFVVINIKITPSQGNPGEDYFLSADSSDGLVHAALSRVSVEGISKGVGEMIIPAESDTQRQHH